MGEQPDVLEDPRTQRGLEPRRRPVLAGVAVVAVTVGAVLAALALGDEQPAAAPAAPSPAAAAPPGGGGMGRVVPGPTLAAEAHLPWADTPLPRRLALRAPAPALSADPVRSAVALFQVRPVERSDRPVLVLGDDGRLRRLDSVRLPPVTDPNGTVVAALSSTSLSPGGRRAAFASRDGVVVVDLASGGARRYAVRGRPGEVRWSPDGTRLLVSGPGHALVLDLATGGAARVDTTVPDTAYAPDGTLVELPGSASGPGPRLRTVGPRGLVRDLPVDAPVLDWVGAAWVRGGLLVRDAVLLTEVEVPGTDVPHAGGLVVLDRRTGGLVRLLPMGVSDPSGPHSRGIGCCVALGWQDPRRVVLTSWSSRSSRLLAWDIETGQVARISELDTAATVALPAAGLH